MAVEPLPAVRAVDLERVLPDARWLVEDLWLKGAQGIVGGGPKLGKTWLGLDLAVSVASGTPCLGRFAVHDPGPVLIYLAEDTLPAVRERLESICDARGQDLARLDLGVITVPVLRLDQEQDRLRLGATIAKWKPRLVLLDPLVRIHRIDENSATEVSALLGFLTELVRRYNCALCLAHHTSKRQRARPGQALRGSSDLHAWGSSNAYLTQDHGGLTLTVEHRAAPAPDPFRLRLVSRKDGSGTHLMVVGEASEIRSEPIERRIEAELETAGAPMLRRELRMLLRVNNHRLGEALERLEHAGRVRHSAEGWESAPSSRTGTAVPGQGTPNSTHRRSHDAQTNLL